MKPYVYGKEDQAAVKFLAELRGQSVASFDFLPPTGIVVYEGDVGGRPITPLCCGFLIKCDNGIGIFTDFLSDPHIAKKVRNEAVEMMRESLVKLAKASNLKFVTSYTKHKKLAERLAGLGWKKIDSEFTQMGRVLWP